MKFIKKLFPICILTLLLLPASSASANEYNLQTLEDQDTYQETLTFLSTVLDNQEYQDAVYKLNQLLHKTNSVVAKAPQQSLASDTDTYVVEPLTPSDANVSLKAISFEIDEAETALDVEKVIFEYEIEITAQDELLHLSEYSGLNAQENGGFKLYVEGLSEDFMGNVVSYISESSTIQVGDYYQIRPKETESFTLRIEVESAVDTVMRAVVDSVYFKKSDITGASYKYDVSTDSRYVTKPVSIEGGGDIVLLPIVMRGVSSSAMVDEAETSGEDEKGVFELEVNVTATEKDLWIPEAVQLSGDDVNQAGFTFEVIGNTFAGDLVGLISDYRNAEKINNRIKIAARSSAQFTIRVEIKSEQDGVYGIKLKEMYYATDADAVLEVFTIPDDTSFTTDKIGIIKKEYRTDKCPNLSGTQYRVPVGYEMQFDGSCVEEVVIQQSNSDDTGMDEDDEISVVTNNVADFVPTITRVSKNNLKFGQTVNIFGDFTKQKTNKVIFKHRKTGKNIAFDNLNAKQNHHIQVTLPEQVIKKETVRKGKGKVRTQNVSKYEEGVYDLFVRTANGKTNIERVRITN